MASALIYWVDADGKDRIIGELFGTFEQIAEWAAHRARQRSILIPSGFARMTSEKETT
jgi:hypothetical protein